MKTSFCSLLHDCKVCIAYSRWCIIILFPKKYNLLKLLVHYACDKDVILYILDTFHWLYFEIALWHCFLHFTVSQQSLGLFWKAKSWAIVQPADYPTPFLRTKINKMHSEFSIQIFKGLIRAQWLINYDLGG